MYLIRGANGIPSIVWDRLQPVRALFPDAQVIPVGNRAEDALKKGCANVSLNSCDPARSSTRSPFSGTLSYTRRSRCRRLLCRDPVATARSRTRNLCPSHESPDRKTRACPSPRASDNAPDSASSNPPLRAASFLPRRPYRRRNRPETLLYRLYSTPPPACPELL